MDDVQRIKPDPDDCIIFKEYASGFAGTALASRNEQYERFYLGSSSRNLLHAQQRAERGRADRLVDRFLREPP